MSEYYNFVQFNNTDSSVLCNHTEVKLVPIVRRADDYELQIVKFVLPSQSIPVFNIENNNDYRIQYSMPRNGFSPTLGWTTMISSNSLPQSSVNPIYSVNDWIEEWNRTSLATYRDLLTELDVNGQFTTFASVNHTNNITMTAGVPPGSNVYHDETYTMVLPSSSTVGYI